MRQIKTKEKELPVIVKAAEKADFLEERLKDFQNNGEWVHRGVPDSTGEKKLDWLAKNGQSVLEILYLLFPYFIFLLS